MKYQHSEILKLLDIHDDESFENEETLTSNKLFSSSQGTLSARLMSCIFFTTYAITKNIAVSRWWGVFILLYHSLQLLSLAFVSDPNTTPVPTFTWLKDQLDFITFRSVVTADTTIVQTSFFLVLAVIALTFLLTLWVGKQFWLASPVGSPISTLLLQYLVHLETTILYMPFTTVLATSMNCDTGIIPCDGSAEQYLLVTGVFLLLAAFVTMIVFVSLVTVENYPLSSDVRVAPHGRIQAVACLIAALTNIINTMLRNDNEVIQITTVLCCGIAITFLYIQYLPYYRPFYNRFHSALCSMTAWGGFCLLISYLLNDTSRYMFVACLLMGIPLIFAAVVLFVIVREASLSEQVVERGMSAYKAEIILRCKWQERAYGSQLSEYRKLVDDFYPENPFMLLHLSSMYLASGSASLLAGQYMSKANRCRIKSLDMRFRIFHAFRKQQEEKSSDSGTLNYMTLKHHQTNAESNILDALNLIQYLFDALMSGTLSPTELFKIANKVDRASVRAKDNLIMLIKLTKSAPRTLLLYSLYASEILFDYRLSKRLHKAAHDTFRMNGMENESHLEEVTVVISGNEANIGIILDCSDNIENAYGYAPSDVIGRSIDALCPPPINSGAHARLLKFYIETAESFVPIVKPVWIRHTEGHSVRCNLNISPVQDLETGNLVFQGKFTKTQQDVDFVGIRPAGEILFYSAGMLKSFGLRSFFEKGNGQDVKIQTVIPAVAHIDFEGMYDKLQNNPSYTETLLLEMEPGESYKLQITPKSIPHADLKFTIVDIKLIEDTTAIGPETESDDSDNDSNDEEAVGVFNRVQSVQSLEESIKGTRTLDDETSSGISDSRSSIRAASKMRLAIRNNIIAEKNRFDKFRRLGIMFAITFIGMAIVSIVTNHVTFTNMKLGIDSFHESGDRVAKILASGTAFLSMMKNDSNSVDGNAQLIRDTLLKNANEIEATHQNILHMGASQSPEIQNLLFNSSLISEYHSDHTTSLTSFNTLVLSIVAQMRAFLNSGEMVCEAACQFVVNNVQWDLIQIALEMIVQYKNNIEHTFNIVGYINLSLVVISALVVIFVLFLFVTPRLLEVKRVKDDVSMSVGSIQTNTLRRVCNFNAHRIQKVSMMIEHINKAPNPFILDTSKFGKEIRLGNTKINMKRQTSANEGHTRIRWMRCCCRKPKKATVVYPNPNGFNKNEKETTERVEFKERGLSSSLIISFVKMSIPLLLIPVFFAMVFLAYQNLRISASTYLNSLNANVIRQVDFQKLTFSSHAPLNNPPVWTRWYADPTLYNITRTVSNLLENISSSINMIQYGNNAGEGTPLIDKTRTPHLYALYYVDACSPLPSCVNARETIPDYPVIKTMGSGLRVAVDGIERRTETFLVNTSIEIISFPATFPLADANDLAVQYFQTNLLDHINSVEGATLALSLIAMIVFVLVFVYLIRVFRGINNELVDAQSLFLLLPGDVLDSIPEMNRILGLFNV